MVSGPERGSDALRARGLSVAFGCAIVAALLFAALNAAIGDPSAIVDLVGGLILAAVWIGRRRLSPLFLAHALTAVGTTIVAAATWTNGPFLSNYLWFFPIPPIAALLAGRRAGMVSLAVSVALIAGFEVAVTQGWGADKQPVARWFQLLILFAVFAIMALFAFTYDRSRERAERRLDDARRRAEEADQAKGRFLACITHELRTPMHGILGMTEELSLRGVAPEQRELVATVHASGRSMLRLIDDLLDHSKIEAGRVELESRAFDPRALVEEALAVLRPRARDKGLELRAEIAAGVPVGLLGDGFRLRQVLLNLLGNALKFTERGAVVVELSAPAEGRVRVAVRDTGIGIAPAALATLFDSFTQADASTSRKFGGTGLGLSISRGLVEAMGGALSVDSALGRGSTFSFELPLPRTDAPRTSTPAPALALDDARVAQRQARVVLVADDDAVNRRIASMFLERSGYRCEVVSDGAAAVERVRREGVHAVLLDCHMPRLDGPGAAAQIRALTGPGAQVPLIALTAAADQDGPLCLAAGMDAVLGKPITIVELIEMVDRWVLDPRGVEAVRAEPPRPEPARSSPRPRRTATPQRGVSLLSARPSRPPRSRATPPPEPRGAR